MAQVVTVVIGFFVVMWVLKAYAWGPVIKAIDDRRETITKEFQTIDEKQAKLESQIKDYEERLRQIDAEARERMNKAIDEGKKTATEMVETARKQSEEMKQKASADIQLEIEKARVELRDEMVKLTIGATEKLLRKQLDEQGHRELVGSFISELESKAGK